MTRAITKIERTRTKKIEPWARKTGVSERNLFTLRETMASLASSVHLKEITHCPAAINRTNKYNAK